MTVLVISSAVCWLVHCLMTEVPIEAVGVAAVRGAGVAAAAAVVGSVAATAAAAVLAVVAVAVAVGEKEW